MLAGLTLIVPLITTLFTPLSAHATGGDDCDYVECESYFLPEVIENPPEHPFFYSARTFYQGPNDSSNNSQDRSASIQAVNLTEWERYFEGRVKTNALEYFVYKMSSAEVMKLLTAVQGKQTTLSPEAKAIKQQFDQFGKRSAVVAAVRYMGFAKHVEPLVTKKIEGSGWGTEVGARPTPTEIGDAERLIGTAKDLLKKTSSPFLAEKYMFQIERLHFYSMKYAEAESYYEQNIGKFGPSSSARFRFMDAAAGSYYHNKKYARANYIYSLIFSAFPALKKSAYFSFHPKEESDWKEALAMAKSPHEKASLWQLVGLYGDGLEAIHKIYSIDPASKMLPLLLVREINKIESDWTSNRRRYRDDGPNSVPGNALKPDEEIVGKKRLAALKLIADAGKTYKPQLWKLAVGHLYGLLNDQQSAEHYLQLAVKSPGASPLLREQARMSTLLVRARSYKTVDQKKETYFANELSWLAEPKRIRSQTLTSFVRETLSDFYAKNGDSVHALLLNDRNDSNSYRDNKKLEKVIAFVAGMGQKTVFDKFLIKTYGYTLSQLEELRAINLFYAGDFRGAILGFGRANKEAQAKLPGDPFVVHIRDCHDCDHEAPKNVVYTKLSFAQRMDVLQQKAQGSGQEAALASFDLASGFYNMSYYGNSRALYYTDHSNFFERYQAALDNEKAEQNYKRAASLASDKEFGAKAMFMAAKAEQNKYLTRNYDRWGELTDDKGFPTEVRAPVNFKTLKDTYSDTRYYQEIIRECGYFRNYLKK